MKKLLLLGAFAIIGNLNAQSNVYSYGFDSSFSANFTLTNQSTPSTATIWSKAAYTTTSSPIFGSTTGVIPVGQAGGSNSFALVNYTSTSGTGTISNWMITPVVNVMDGDVVSFYTRKGTNGTTDYPDRLELRYSSAATHVVPSGGASDVGSFTNLGVTVNPNLAGGFVYPNTWTKYTFTVSGVGSTPVPVKFAFRYYVTNGGPSGANSDIIGVDTFSVDRPIAAVSNANANKKVSVYPNPTSDYLKFTSQEKVKSVSVFDASGKNVTVNLSNNEVDVRNLAKGVYIIKAETASGVVTDKFIKE